jgi:hypothetical protein
MRRMFVKIFLLLFLISIQSIRAKCLEGNCENGYGTAQFAKGDIYTGEWKDGLAQGKGTLQYKNGNKYFGEWDQGKANGVGEMIYADNTRYVGDWKDSQADGIGTFYDKDGKVLYFGKWKTGKIVETKNKKR